jgi:hypothetical protein
VKALEAAVERRPPLAEASPWWDGCRHFDMRKLRHLMPGFSYRVERLSRQRVNARMM